MSVNSVSNHNHAHHTRAARTQETNSQQEQAPRIDKNKRGGDTFERKPFNINGNTGNGQNVIYGGHIGGNRETNAREPDKDASERVYGSGVTQYEKTAAAAPVSEQETKTPVTNSEKIEAQIQALYKEPVSDERNAKISELVHLSTVEWFKENGIKVNTGDTNEERLDYENRVNAAINGTSSTTASEPPVYKSADEVKQEFAADASNFLADAAAKILNGDEGASLSSLGINSSDFVDKMLESFGSNYHSSDEVSTLMKQSEDLIREFAKQISDGQQPDFNSLATELTINGANTTLGQLMGK